MTIMSSVLCLAIFALISVVRTSSAALIAVDGVTASENGWDTRKSGFGCASSGCVAANAVDDSLEPASRWSCNAIISDVEACELTLELDTPQDIEAIKIALWKGDIRKRAINIWVDGELASSIESSGTTEDYEMYSLAVIGATTVVFQAAGVEDNGWLSILEVQILVDDGSTFEGSPAPSPTPTGGATGGSSASTAAPTLGDSGCLSGSISPSLEIVVLSTGRLGIKIREPGGKELGSYNENIGDVGTLMHSYLQAGFGSPEYKHAASYVLSNGLSVDTDPILGDYTVVLEIYSDDVPLIITAHSNGELLWEDSGTYSDVDDDLVYTATVTEYTESDCIRNIFGECPGGSVGVDGRQPCTECPGERVSRVGTTFCTVRALRNAGLTEEVAAAIEVDAIGGFVSPGFVDLDDGLSAYDPFYLYEEDSNTLQLSGTFETRDGTALPDSVALLLYIESEDAPDDFIRGQAIVDASTAAFSATFTDVPEKYSKAILSFVTLDPADAVDVISYGDSVFVLDVVNEGCSEAPLRISLDWDEEEYITGYSYVFAWEDPVMNLFVDEPSGNRVSGLWPVSDIGYLNLDRRENVVFGGLSGDEMLGDFQFLARYENYFNFDTTVNWSLTVEVDGTLVWMERGTLSEADQVFFSRDDIRRRLLT